MCGVLEWLVARWRKRAFWRQVSTAGGREEVAVLLQSPEDGAWVRGMALSMVRVRWICREVDVVFLIEDFGWIDDQG